MVIIAMVGLSHGARADTTFTLAGAGGGWFHPELGGHGIAIVAVDVTDLYRDGVFYSELNTDTLRVGFRRARFADGLLELGVEATGEALFAGLLTDYYRRGERDAARGFAAHYVMLSAYAKLNLPGGHYLSLMAAGRKWFFSAMEKTHEQLVLPSESFTFEPRLHYTFWKIRSDPSIGDRHRLFWRVEGIAVGVEGRLDLQSNVRPWGALDETVFDIPDTRNNPDKVALIGVQWLRAGVPVVDFFRIQLAEIAMYGSGADDLNRYRVGGMNPYVVPIAGAPWAAFLSERFVAAELSLHFEVSQNIDVGMLSNGVYLDDVARTGTSDSGFQWGIGLLFDFRKGPYQLDIRAGWSPSMRWISNAGSFAAFLAFGRNWSLGSES